MKETMKAKIARLEKELEESEQEAMELRVEVREYRNKEEQKNKILHEREEVRRYDVEEENRKLWYLVRTLVKDENLKPIEYTDDMGRKQYIDIFHGNQGRRF